MLTKYRSSISADLHSACFDWFRQAMIDHNLSRLRILDKWFYFYACRPREPVVVWVRQNTAAVHPGTNRLIGRSLRRDANDLLPAIVIAEDSTDWPRDLSPGIAVDHCDLAWPRDINSRTDPAIQWAVGSETTFQSRAWTKEVYAWISQNLQRVWALKYRGRIYCVNWGPHRGFRWGIAITLCQHLNLPRPLGAIVDADNYDNLAAAVQALFETIVEQEGIRLE